MCGAADPATHNGDDEDMTKRTTVRRGYGDVVSAARWGDKMDSPACRGRVRVRGGGRRNHGGRQKQPPPRRVCDRSAAAATAAVNATWGDEFSTTPRHRRKVHTNTHAVRRATTYYGVRSRGRGVEATRVPRILGSTTLAARVSGFSAAAILFVHATRTIMYRARA